MQFDVYNVDDQGWLDAFNRIPAEKSDIGFLPDWYNTWQDFEQAIPKCIVAESGGIILFYPFFLKPIEDFNLGKTYFDIQTAYGYGGVISNSTNISNQITEKFNKEVNHWLYDNDVIAEFIREHPLLNQCRRDADYIRVRQNVYIETNREYRIPDKKARQNVSKSLRNKDIQILIDDKLEHLDEFINLYKQNTIRLNMSKFYLFPDDYFKKVRDLLGKNARLIHILYKSRIINSSLYFFFGNKGTMHLAGSDHEFQNMRGNDLMYYAAVELSKNMGHDILTIGGGLTSNVDDTLFRFKSKFGDLIKDVMIGKKVINPDIYNKVLIEWEKKFPDLGNKYRNFFLKYRQLE